MSERLEEMLEFYNHHSNDEDLMDMIGILRDRFLKHEVINKKHGYDILSELVCGPEHVIFYTAEYIDILERQNELLREFLEQAFKADDLEDIWNIEDEYRALEESE